MRHIRHMYQSNINEIDRRASLEDVRQALVETYMRISNRTTIMSYAKHRISEGLQGFAANSQSRKDLPICGSQFESGYKSE